MPEIGEQEVTLGSLLLGVWVGLLFLGGLAAWLHVLVNRRWMLPVKGPPPVWKPPFPDFALLGITLLLAVVVVSPVVAMELMNFLPQEEEGLSEWAFLLQALSLQGAILGFLLLFYMVQRKVFATHGGGPSGGVGYALKWGFYGFVLAIPGVWLSSAITLFLFRLFGLDYNLQETVEFIADLENTLLLVAMCIPVVVLAPLWEEIIFRGGLFRYLKNFMPVFVAVLLSAACFSLIHGQPAQFGGLFVMGLILALVYQKSGTLWAPIFLHAFFNANTLLAVFVMRAGS